MIGGVQQTSSSPRKEKAAGLMYRVFPADANVEERARRMQKPLKEEIESAWGGDGGGRQGAPTNVWVGNFECLVKTAPHEPGAGPAEGSMSKVCRTPGAYRKKEVRKTGGKRFAKHGRRTSTRDGLKERTLSTSKVTAKETRRFSHEGTRHGQGKKKNRRGMERTETRPRDCGWEESDQQEKANKRELSKRDWRASLEKRSALRPSAAW